MAAQVALRRQQNAQSSSSSPANRVNSMEYIERIQSMEALLAQKRAYQRQLKSLQQTVAFKQRKFPLYFRSENTLRRRRADVHFPSSTSSLNLLCCSLNPHLPTFTPYSSPNKKKVRSKRTFFSYTAPFECNAKRKLLFVPIRRSQTHTHTHTHTVNWVNTFLIRLFAVQNVIKFSR